MIFKEVKEVKEVREVNAFRVPCSGEASSVFGFWLLAFCSSFFVFSF
jgi:hypothetical protein